MATEYHAKLYAHELTQRCSVESVERLTNALLDAQVELNPHQVDAALFAFKSPPMRGAILADEVGLGKTIEAGIVLSQHWAERKRKILIILPANLRKQWSQELQEKFYLPSVILEATSFNKAVKEKKSTNPFESDKIVLCSYQFAKNKADYAKKIRWDIVVIDEAHRLRNVYQSGNIIAKTLRDMLEKTPKLLLTATPLQNTLKELFGLVSFIDEHVFGDIRSFQSQFGNSPSEAQLKDLRERLAPICKRTLRRQVLEYIKYTNRKPYTQKFTPTTAEEMLYQEISEYLRRPDLQALPSGQRQLITLVLRKQLASSTYAIAGSMETMANRLQKRLDASPTSEIDVSLDDDIDGIDELADELEEELDDETEENVPQLAPEQRELIEKEIEELRDFHRRASGIKGNAKGTALLSALHIGFDMTRETGAAQKAIIFTESRRTQKYLLELLGNHGYADDDIVLFNGSNNDPNSRKIYADWKARHQGTDRITGSATADTRAALVEHFRDKAKIMIATEAAAEGINLQFCSMVVNYDLPWNPQRIEQRIGRCHRYGQKHDVVVVNFLNESNAADRRAFQLLEEKFQLFDGVFGSSDEVLGTIESGVEFEKRLLDIYQTCRTDAEIEESFNALQEKMDEIIKENLRETRQKLLENVDAEVAEKLGVYHGQTDQAMKRNEKLLWDLTKYVLADKATFDDSKLTFLLREPPNTRIPTGQYFLKNERQREIQEDIQGFHYRTQHPLAQWVSDKAKRGMLSGATLTFTLDRNIAALEKYVGKSGLFLAKWLEVQSINEEEHVILAAVDSAGNALDAEETRRLFDLPATVEPKPRLVIKTDSPLCKLYEQKRAEVLGEISRKDGEFLDNESEKLDRWAEDCFLSLKAKLKEFDNTIKETKKELKGITDVREKLKMQRQLKEWDVKRKDARTQYDDDYQRIVAQKDELLANVEALLDRFMEEEILFTVEWKLVKP